MNYLALIILFALVTYIAHWQAIQFAAQKAINHTVWAAIFIGLILILWLSASDPWDNFFPLLLKNWATLAALTLEHFVYFNPTLNLFRTPQEKFFYTHSGPGGSKLDALLSKYPVAYPVAWVISAAGFLTLTIFYL